MLVMWGQLCGAVALLLGPVTTYGTMPDASQEGVLKQYRSYEDIALFHYTVPPETTRATWEFASFQARTREHSSNALEKGTV